MNNSDAKSERKATILVLVFVTGMAIFTYFAIGPMVEALRENACTHIDDADKIAECQGMAAGAAEVGEYLRLGALALIPVAWIVGLVIVPRFMKNKEVEQ
jgi:hypothetical protein